MKNFSIEVINKNLKNVTINTNLVNCVVTGIRIAPNKLGYAPTMSVTKIFLDEVNAQNSTDSIVKIKSDDFAYTLLLSKSFNGEINILTLSEVRKNAYEVINALRTNNAYHIEQHIRHAMSSVELSSVAGCNIFDEIMKNELKEVEIEETKASHNDSTIPEFLPDTATATHNEVKIDTLENNL